MRKTDPQNYTYYELVYGGNYHFDSYTTGDGKTHRLVESEDGNEKTFKRFHLNKGRLFPVHNDNKKTINYLNGHPNNPKSEWFSGKTIFKVVEREKDAANEIDLTIAKSKAITLAAELKGKRLLEVASLCGGFFDVGEEQQALRSVLKFATLDHEKFLGILNVPAREAAIRRIVGAAVRNGTIYKENGVYKFSGEVLGDGEDTIVSRLTNDKDMLHIIEVRAELRDAPEKSVPENEEKEESEVPSITPEEVTTRASKFTKKVGQPAK